MKSIVKIAFLASLAFNALLSSSQNTFEKVFEELGQAEIRASIETSDNDFILAISPTSLNVENNYLIKISSCGDVIDSFNYEISDGSLVFLGLFYHPTLDDVFIVPAVIYDGQRSAKVAIISIDKDMNIVEDKRCDFSNIVQDLTPVVVPSVTVYDNEMAMTAHVILNDDEYANLYARISLNGECLAVCTDNSYNTPAKWTTSIDLVNKTDKCFAVLNRNTDELSGQSLFINMLDSTMTVQKSKKIEYDNASGMSYIFFTPNDTPVLKALNDTTIIIDLMARKIIARQSYSGYCIATMNHDLDIIETVDYFYDEPDIMVRLPLRKSFNIHDDYIYSCSIINLHSYHPLYKTRCLVAKYDMDMNVIWERFVNQKDGYYYPIYVLATEDGGCLLTGYSCDDSYQNKYSYALKTDADGYLGIGENHSIEVKPFLCYPNPAKDNICIEISPDVTCDEIVLYSIDGRIIKSQSASFENIDISGLSQGLYILKVKLSDGKEFSERIIKN